MRTHTHCLPKYHPQTKMPFTAQPSPPTVVRLHQTTAPEDTILLCIVLSATSVVCSTATGHSSVDMEGDLRRAPPPSLTGNILYCSFSHHHQPEGTRCKQTPSMNPKLVGGGPNVMRELDGCHNPLLDCLARWACHLKTSSAALFIRLLLWPSTENTGKYS